MIFRLLLERTREEKGQSLIDFALCGLLLVMLFLGIVEIGRLVLVYNTVANSARAGARYAIVHGSNSTVSAAQLQTQVQTVVKNFLRAAPMNTLSAALSINVTCSADGSTYSACSTSSNTPGCGVKVSVNYTYDPIVRYFPWPAIILGSTTRGVITF